MKLNIGYSILGFFLPFLGILLGFMLYSKSEMVGRSIKRGSALSSVLLIIVGIPILFYFIFKK